VPLLAWAFVASAAQLALIGSPTPAQAATVTVSTTADVSNGDTASPAALAANPGPDGIALREAILATDSTAGPHSVTFSPALDGQTIQLANSLPSLTRPFVSLVGRVNGSGDPLVTIDSQNVAGAKASLHVQASYVDVRQLRFALTPPSVENTVLVTAGKLFGQGAGPPLVRHVRIADNVFTNTGLDTPMGVPLFAVALGAGPIETPGGVDNVVIARNRIVDYDEDGVIVRAGDLAPMSVTDGATITNVTVDANTFTRDEYPLELGASGDDTHVAHTRITHNQFIDSPLLGGVFMGAGPRSGNSIADTLIEGNLFSSDQGGAVNITSGDGATATGNAITDNRIFNNVVARQTGIKLFVVAGQNGASNNLVDGVSIANNTLPATVGSSTLLADSNQGGGTGNTVSDVSVRNTIFRGTGTDFSGVSPSQVSNSITCQTGFAGVNGNVCADPLFVDASTGDFHLQAGSPAIDAGTSDGAPPLDNACGARVDDPATTNTGSGTPDYFDIGAFEFGASGGPCAALDTSSPGSVSNLAASSGPAGIDLTWTNPLDPDLAEVIARMTQGDVPPPTPEDGTAVFNGLGSSAMATGLLSCTTYSFSVFTRDASSNVGLPASISATYAPPECLPPAPPGGPGDVDPPETKIVRGPRRRTHSRTARFEFSADEAGSTFECRLDNHDYAPCAAKLEKRVKAGKRHRFQVRAIDAAGNVDPTPAIRTWRVLR
jgi:hypothetical protein